MGRYRTCREPAAGICWIAMVGEQNPQDIRELTVWLEANDATSHAMRAMRLRGLLDMLPVPSDGLSFLGGEQSVLCFEEIDMIDPVFYTGRYVDGDDSGPACGGRLDGDFLAFGPDRELPVLGVTDGGGAFRPKSFGSEVLGRRNASESLARVVRYPTVADDPLEADRLQVLGAHCVCSN